MSLSHTVESLLFVSTRPLTAKKIAEICNEEMSAVEKILLICSRVMRSARAASGW
jgi:chromosome segregation and condensation protein ScpB